MTSFGIFFGGDLEGEAQVYTYFLIRKDGSVLVKSRDGMATSTLHGWTPHDAVVTWRRLAHRQERPRSRGRAERLTLHVNGQEVYATERAGHHVDGSVGLRVNHGLNLHVSTLEVTSN